MICFPHAKINLGLNIINKRVDGYHNIESVFYPVPLHDVLEFKASKTYSIKTFGITLDVGQEENILFKTWRLLNQKYAVPPLEIVLLKNIPPGSGLGGGSSDAAFLIKSANIHFNLGLTLNDMKSLAALIGSDCPFFIENGPAFVTGRGEKMEKTKVSLNEKYLVVISPIKKIATSAAYAQIKPRKPNQSINEIILQPIETWKNELKNDFEELIFKKYPKIRML
jgi:4-diphosphocytidyl-2-C-methyl-D-erythritol kinase